MKDLILRMETAIVNGRHLYVYAPMNCPMVDLTKTEWDMALNSAKRLIPDYDVKHTVSSLGIEWTLYYFYGEA